MKTSLAAILGMAILLTGGCKKAGNSNEAIRQGIIDHLSNRAGLDVKMMQIDVTAVNFRNNNNEADATVSFKPKGGDSSAGMSMSYTLEKKGDRWVVKGRRDSGGSGSPHGAGGGSMLPGAMPPAGGMGSMPPGAAMPPGHPPAGGAEKKK